MLSRALEIATAVASPITSEVNERLKDYTPSQVIVLALAGYLTVKTACNAYDACQRWGVKNILSKLKESAFQKLAHAPVVGKIIQAEIDKEVLSVSDDIKADVDKKRAEWNPLLEIPEEGLKREQILERFEKLQEHYHEGRISGAVYAKWDAELQRLLEEVWGKTALTNPMHSEWSQINLMEAEVISMCHELLHSPLNTLIERLEVIKPELKKLQADALASQPKLVKENADLLEKRNQLKIQLQQSPTDKDRAAITKEITNIDRRLKKIPREAIKANASIRDQHATLSKERVELEKKVRNPGIMTHGGSSSIFEACKAHVFHARENGVKKPVIIIPETAHVSFDKAAKILDADIVKVPVDKTTGRVDLAAMEKAIQTHKGNVAMMVGSAPSFVYGVVDPIPELGAMAKKHNIPLHVDSCLGGFLTAFAKNAGIELPPCDLSVPGVSSVSIDTHKYGETPKGTSVLVFHPDCKASTTHTHLDWPGGMYVTEGLDGSRSGADIATTWTVLCHYGAKHYIEEVKNIVALRKETETQIRDIEGLVIAYDKAAQHKLNVIGIRAKEGIDLLLVEKKMKELNWGIQIMQTPDQRVDGLHFCLTSVHTKNPQFAKEFSAALAQAFEYAKSKPADEATGNMKVYGKLKEGVPFFVQQQIGESYVGAHNTIRRARR